MRDLANAQQLSQLHQNPCQPSMSEVMDDHSTGSQESLYSTEGSDVEPDRDYDRVLNRLQNTTRAAFSLQMTNTILLVLDNVDCFCELLSSAKHIREVNLGVGEDICMKFAGISDQQLRAWEKLCLTLGNLGTVEELWLGGYSLCGNMMARAIRALPKVNKVSLSLPRCRALSRSDMGLVLKAMQHNGTPASISIHLHERSSLDYWWEGDIEENGYSDDVPALFEDTGPLSDFLRLNAVEQLALDGFQLQLDECKSLATLLSANSCSATVLSIQSCAFQDGGEEIFACALKANTRLTHLHMASVLNNRSMCQALLTSLPLNTKLKQISISAVAIGDEIGMDNFEFDFLKCCATQNTALENIMFLSREGLREEQELQLADALKNNYNLKRIARGYGTTPVDSYGPAVETILELNRAGRRYLLEDAGSKEKCVQVLEGANEHVGALFYHLRENPILFDFDPRRIPCDVHSPGRESKEQEIS